MRRGAAVGTVAALGLGVAALVAVGVLDVEHVDVALDAPRGGVQIGEQEVTDLLGPVVGASLLTVSPGDLEERVARDPRLAAVDVTRRWPDSLLVRAVVREPVAVVAPGAGDGEPVDAEGRPVPGVPEGVADGLPRLELEPGADVAAGLDLVAALPEPLVGRVERVVGAGPDLTLVLRDGARVHVGGTDVLPRKLEVAAAVLRGGPPAASVDVRDPDVAAVVPVTAEGADEEPAGDDEGTG